MAKARFDIKDIAQLDIKGEAKRGLNAGVGAADLAIEAVRHYVADAQTRVEGFQKDAQKAFASAQQRAQQSVKDIDLQPQALRSQATTVLSARVEELSKDAKARRAAIEKRVTDLQAEAQKLATGTYEQLAKRGELVVKRLRKQTASVADPGPVSKTTGVTTTATGPTATKAPAKKATTAK